MGATASLQPTALGVTPGAEAAVEVRIRNTGSVVDQFAVEVLGDASGWATVVPPSVSLFPGADAVVRVVFTPQAVAGGPSGAVPFGVRVRSHEDPEGTVVEEGVLEVTATLAVDVELTPRTSRGRRRAVHQLAIDNRGNRSVQLAITASDPDQLLDFAVDPPSLLAAANTAAFVDVKVRAAKPFRKGPSQTHPFQVVVDEGGQPLAVAAGMMLQEPTQPAWLRKALLGALAAVVLLVAGWLALKQTVESAARTAAKEEVQAQTTPSVIGGSDGGSGSPNATLSTNTTTTIAGTTPAESSAVGVPFDTRLFLTAKGTTAVQVAAGGTLQVTDIVLQNPAGDTGPLQIRRSGTPLLVVELANFRDLDYHFVAPLVFKAGQTLELSADCVSAGCTPGAYVAGFLVTANKA